jgi:chromosome segregation ATPase
MKPSMSPEDVAAMVAATGPILEEVPDDPRTVAALLEDNGRLRERIEKLERALEAADKAVAAKQEQVTKAAGEASQAWGAHNVAKRKAEEASARAGVLQEDNQALERELARVRRAFVQWHRVIGQWLAESR